MYDQTFEHLAKAHQRERTELARRVALIKAALEDNSGEPDVERTEAPRDGITEAIRILGRQELAGA